MRIAVDAMGGDFAPREVVRGAIDYAATRGDQVILVGAGEQIEREIEEYGKGHPPRVSVVDAPEVIGMGDHPAAALRTKKRASLNFCHTAAGETGNSLVPSKCIMVCSSFSALSSAVFGGKLWNLILP